MHSPEIIESILKRGTEGGLQCLAPLERKVWLVSEAEVLCDMEGIGAFLDRYAESLSETADASAEAGASQIAGSLRAINARLPARPDELLDETEALVTARAGYDYDAVLRIVSGKC
jgi:hypothetical protein